MLEDLLDVRPQLTRFRIDNGELLFNAESKRVVLGAHRGWQMSPKNNSLSSRGLFGTPLACQGKRTASPTDWPLLVGLTPVRLRNALLPRQICLEQTFKKFAMVGDFEMEQFVNNNELLEPIRLVKQV